MKIEKFQLRDNSVCAGAFHLLLGRAPAQLRGNTADECAKENGTNTSGMISPNAVEA
jgi:hypothetical protein